MKKVIYLLVSLSLSSATMWGQQEVRYLRDLKQLSEGTEFEYRGMAKVYNNQYRGITLDDGTDFVSLYVTDNGELVSNTEDDTKAKIPVKAKDIVCCFKGKVLTEADPVFVPGPVLGYSAELSTIDYLPELGDKEYEMSYVLATAGENFNDYIYRPCVFRNVKVSKYTLDLPDVAESYEVVDDNGAKGIFIVPKSTGNDLTGEYAWIKCTPIGGGLPYPSPYIGLEEVELGQTPIAELSRAKQIYDIEPGNSFVFNGEAVVYYSDANSITLDNGDDYVVLGLEYWSGQELPKPGEVIKAFTGRVASYPTGLEVTGGRDFNTCQYRINCRSIVTTGENCDLVPVEADPTKSFRDYSDRFVKFHDVTVTCESAGELSDLYTATLSNGSQAYLGYFKKDADLCGVYEDITCVPQSISAYPGAVLNMVKYGNKAGVDTVAADSAVEYEYYDLQGRHISAPTANGIYLMKGSDGSVKKLKL